MAKPNRIVYSGSHDVSRFPQGSRRRKKAVANNSRISQESGSPNPPPPPPAVAPNFLPKNLSEDQRRELRARQLAASPNFLDDPNQPHVYGPIPDHDVTEDEDLDVTDPRGDLFNLEEGPVNTIFPVIRGPQFTHTKTRILGPEEEYPDLPDFEHPSQVNASQEEVPLGLIAAVSADDREILAFDNKMSEVHTALKGLRQIAQRMQVSVARQDENKGKEDSATAHAQNIVKLLSTIVEPWFNVLEEEFSALLGETSQSEELEEGE
jgi:hypothetical protein